MGIMTTSPSDIDRATGTVKPAIICDPVGPEINYNLYQGSGGKSIIIALYERSGSSTIISSSAIETKAEINQETHGRFENVFHEICSVFSLTKVELADVCKIQSRKTLYNWINEEASPRKSAMKRIFDLLIVAKAWQQSGFHCSRQQLYQPILDGRSIFDLLNQAEINKEVILFAGSRLNLMSQAKNKIQDPFG